MTDQRPGGDIETRALLYRVVQRGAALHQVLDELLRGNPTAAARIGLTPETLDGIGRMISAANWASTADLFQLGDDELALRVIARAQELDGEQS
ncbi:hypothetical protein [Mycobacteroides abscessus]|uniref:hypothetical protein n=1 Tax=Mycobacteroides abscessus TaxID=36809 RepID=UPI00266F516B|nr:hypothetical protein [Mycobacteroides abscessus]MDO3110432.1 hypothetical protein [Mycobacteroides abscessus subsp. abscessus]